MKRLLVLLLVCLLAAVTITSVQAQDEDDIMDGEEDIDVSDEAIDAQIKKQMEARETEDEEEEEEPGPAAPKPVYNTPKAKGNVFFTETFDAAEVLNKKWVMSQARKEDTDESIAKYDGKWSIESPKEHALDGDLGLVLKSKAKHHAIAAKLTKPFDFTGNPLVVQYEVKFQNGQECGGAYVKLLQDDKASLGKFYDKTPYTIMFGPDKCGNDNKLHFIFRHQNPKSLVYEEKHAKKPTAAFDKVFTDKKSHLFTLVVHPDQTFEVFVDQNLVNSGSLLEDVEPAVNPPKEIVDPNDKKPEDWDEREKIPDPEAKKPEDWDETQPEQIEDADAVKPDGWLDDEPELIPDPDAEKPEDWDEDMDGEWEAPQINNAACESAPGCGDWKPPMIKNPLYKGKWRAPMIENPEYKGKWKPRKIENPDFFEDLNPYKMTPISAVGLELWSMSDDLLFDNFIITDDKSVADKWAADGWELKSAYEGAASGLSGKSVVDAVMDATKERPWLWAVFIVVIVLPIVLLIAYCCMGSSSKPADLAAARKKDDDAGADIDEEEEEEVEETVEDQGGAGDGKKATDKKAAPKKKSKASLEETEDVSQANEADAEEDEEESKDDSKSASPRRRKTRARKD